MIINSNAQNVGAQHPSVKPQGKNILEQTDVVEVKKELKDQGLQEMIKGLKMQAEAKQQMEAVEAQKKEAANIKAEAENLKKAGENAEATGKDIKDSNLAKIKDGIFTEETGHILEQEGINQFKGDLAMQKVNEGIESAVLSTLSGALKLEGQADKMEKTGINDFGKALKDREAGESLINGNIDELKKLLGEEAFANLIHAGGLESLQEGLKKAAEGDALLGQSQLASEIAHSLENKSNEALLKSDTFAFAAETKQNEASEKLGDAAGLRGDAGELDKQAAGKEAEGLLHGVKSEKFSKLADILAQKGAIDTKYGNALHEIPLHKGEGCASIHEGELTMKASKERKKQSDIEQLHAMANQMEAKGLKDQAADYRALATTLEGEASTLNEKAVADLLKSDLLSGLSQELLKASQAKDGEALTKLLAGLAAKEEGLDLKELGLGDIEFASLLGSMITDDQKAALENIKAGDGIEDATFAARETSLEGMTTGHDLENLAVKAEGAALGTLGKLEGVHDQLMADKEVAFKKVNAGNSVEASGINAQTQGFEGYGVGDDLLHKGIKLQGEASDKFAKSNSINHAADKEAKEASQKEQAGKIHTGKGAEYLDLSQKI